MSLIILLAILFLLYFIHDITPSTCLVAWRAYVHPGSLKLFQERDFFWKSAAVARSKKRARWSEEDLWEAASPLQPALGCLGAPSKELWSEAKQLVFKKKKKWEEGTYNMESSKIGMESNGVGCESGDNQERDPGNNPSYVVRLHRGTPESLAHPKVPSSQTLLQELYL